MIDDNIEDICDGTTDAIYPEVMVMLRVMYKTLHTKRVESDIDSDVE
jgi:hypothetical protein